MNRAEIQEINILCYGQWLPVQEFLQQDVSGTIASWNFTCVNTPHELLTSLSDNGFHCLLLVPETLQEFRYSEWKEVLEKAAENVPVILALYTGNGRETSYFFVKLHGVASHHPADVLLRALEAHERLISLERDASIFQMFAEKASDVLWITDRNGRILYVSPSVEKLTGYSAQEMSNRTVTDIMEPGSFAVFETALRSEDVSFPMTIQLELIHRSGSSVTVEAIVTRLEEGPLGRDLYLGITRDITEQVVAREEKRRLEAQLYEAQKMEALGRLAGGIAHDFNNILLVILSCADMLKHQLDESNPIFEDICDIQQAARKGSELVRSLLSFTRREIVSPEVVDLNNIVRETMSLISRTIGEHIHAEFILSPQPCFIKADPSRIEQVVINLAVNARDAMPRGGTLTVETAAIHVSDDYARKYIDISAGPYAVLSVSDTGSGIPPDVKSKIFEPFFTTKRSGTGIGLSTVYGIVKQAGGDIHVYSEINVGTTFKVYFPLVSEPGSTQQEESKKEGENIVLEALVVLLVEDDASVRKITRQMLKHLGCQVLEADGAAEAVRLLKKYPGGVDLLLTDVIMPHVNGKELADIVQSIEPDVKVLYMSGYTDNVIAQFGVLDEEAYFIQKPFTIDQLKLKIQTIFKGRKKKNQ